MKRFICMCVALLLPAAAQAQNCNHSSSASKTPTPFGGNRVMNPPRGNPFMTPIFPQPSLTNTSRQTQNLTRQFIFYKQLQYNLPNPLWQPNFNRQNPLPQGQYPQFNPLPQGQYATVNPLPQPQGQPMTNPLATSPGQSQSSYSFASQDPVARPEPKLLPAEKPLVRSDDEKTQYVRAALKRGWEAEIDGKLMMARVCYENAVNIYPDTELAANAKAALERLQKKR